MQRIVLLVGTLTACGDNITADNTPRVVGKVFADGNADGALGAGEGGLAGFGVFLDLDDDGILDPGEPTASTDASGAYELEVTAPGMYTVRQQVLPFGFRSSLAQQKPRATPIIGGGDVGAIGDFPFMISVGQLFEGDVFPFCGGVLISDKHVITAAHCSAGAEPGDAGVLAGTLDPFDGSGQVLLVEKITIHPTYDGNTEAGFDIALWTLAEPVALAASGLATVEMMTPATAALGDPGVLATTLGWGVSDRPSPLLQQVHVPMVGEADCAEVYPQATNFETQICAGAAEGGIDSCQGDSGGPLLVRDDARGVWMHAGVTSWGDGCALPGTPGVYARTSALSEWVMGEAREAGGVVRVSVGEGSATANFPTFPTTRPQTGAIEARWQLTGMALPAAIAIDTPVDVSWGIIGESPGLADFTCRFDLDGPGPIVAQDIACGLGSNSVQLAGFTTGIFPAELTVTRASTAFSRRVNVFAGTPLGVDSQGALTNQDPLDPDYFDPYFVDYFTVGGLAGTKAFAIEARGDFGVFLTLYDADQRDFVNGGGILEVGNSTGDGAERIVVVPEPGRRYLVGVSSFAPQDTGDYTVRIINDGTLTPLSP